MKFGIRHGFFKDAFFWIVILVAIITVLVGMYGI